PAFNVNSLAQAGALAALADQAHMRQAVDRTMSELARVEAEFKRLGLWTAPSAANFLLLRLDGPAAPVFEQLLRRGLIVRPLAGYGLANCLRISIGLRQDNDRLLAALPQVPAPSAAQGPMRHTSAAPRFLVRPAAGIRGELTVPGDKSISHRALMRGGIAAGQTAISGFLASEDC